MSGPSINISEEVQRYLDLVDASMVAEDGSFRVPQEIVDRFKEDNPAMPDSEIELHRVVSNAIKSDKQHGIGGN